MADSTTPAGNEPAADATGAPAEGAPVTQAAATDDLAALRRQAAQAQASQSRADQLAARLAKYEQAEREAQLAAAGAEGKLQVELEQARQAAQAAEQRAKTAELKAAYPLAMARLGADALKLSDEVIAGLQADLASATSPEPPAPIGNNPARGTGATTPPKEETSKDILARLKTMGNPWAS